MDEAQAPKFSYLGVFFAAVEHEKPASMTPISFANNPITGTFLGDRALKAEQRV